MCLRARLGAALTALAIALLILTGAHPALAWVDVNVTADDARVSLETGGEAEVEHRITLRVAGGPLRTLDIKGVDKNAVPAAEGYVVPQREALRNSLASAQAVVSELLPEGRPLADGSPAPTVLRIRFDSGRGLGRGVYVLVVRYRTNLVARFEARGSLTHIEWQGPAWDDGFDSARVTFDLPAAPTEPRVDIPEAAEGADVKGAPAPRAPTVLSTLRRGVSRDQLELMRPYAPKGEALTWPIRVDRRALAARPVPAARKAQGARAIVDGALGLRSLFIVGGAAIFAFYALLVVAKSREAARHARAASVAARPLVPLPVVVRAALAGVSLSIGVFVELVVERPVEGALLVIAAIVFAAHRTPLWVPSAALRGLGRWLPVAEADAFRNPPRARGAYLDVSTLAGKALLTVLLSGVFALAWLLFDESPYRAELVALDATALLAIFCTGRIAELPPDPATAPTRFLRAIARRVRRSLPADDLRIVGRIRIPEGKTEPDEVRLAVAPRSAPAGFGGIEIGVVYVPGAGGPIGLPEVLLRVVEGSPCALALDPITRHHRVSRGRKQGERVVSLSPRLPTRRMTAAIVVGLMRALQAAHKATREPGSRETRNAA